MNRVNVGGHSISAEQDTGMFCAWSEDKKFLFNDENDTATLGSKAKIKYSSLFSAYTALEKEDDADVIQWSGGANVPVYRDYLANLSGQGVDYLLIALQSNTESALQKIQAILNGLEILKLSDASNNLAGSSPFRYGARKISSPDNQEILKMILKYLLIGLFALTLVCILLGSIPSKHFMRDKKQFSVLWQSENFRHFSLSEVKSVTNNFSERLLIGAGGFGTVYKGSIDGGTITGAIKRANPCSNHGLNEFRTEISLLSNLQHRHLVSLIGHCVENKEMILVYDYTAGGTLRNHLYNNHKPPLKWMRRLKICIGAARELRYLHTGTRNTLIHRDVKSTNILLDENWVAKASDFGLAKFGPDMLTQSNTHVSTAVKGSFGYLDPEYYRRKKLTEKSDVYSFGVVLFEVLCARPAALPMAENEQEVEHEKVNSADWALRCDQSGTLDLIVDPFLRGKIDPGCLKTFTDIAKRCLAERGCDRAQMGDVLCNLELALWQQEAADRHIQEDGVSTCGHPHIVNINGNCNSEPSPGVEFSEIMIPIGR